MSKLKKLGDMVDAAESISMECPIRVIVEGQHYNVTSIGQKSPFVVLHTEPVKVKNCVVCEEPDDYCDCDK